MMNALFEFFPWLEVLSGLRSVCKDWHRVPWTGRHFWTRVYITNGAVEAELDRDIQQASAVLCLLPIERTPLESHLALACFTRAVHVRGLCCPRTRAHLHQLSTQHGAAEAKLRLLLAAECKNCCSGDNKDLRWELARVIDAVPDSVRKFRCLVLALSSLAEFIFENEAFLNRAEELARLLFRRQEIGSKDLGLFLLELASNHDKYLGRNSAQRYAKEAVPLLDDARAQDDDDDLLMDWEEAVWMTRPGVEKLRELVEARRARYEPTDRRRFAMVFNTANRLPDTDEFKRDLLAEVVQVQTQVLGPNHSETLRSQKYRQA